MGHEKGVIDMLSQYYPGDGSGKVGSGNEIGDFTPSGAREIFVEAHYVLGVQPPSVTIYGRS